MQGAGSCWSFDSCWRVVGLRMAWCQYAHQYAKQRGKMGKLELAAARHGGPCSGNGGRCALGCGWECSLPGAGESAGRGAYPTTATAAEDAGRYEARDRGRRECGKAGDLKTGCKDSRGCEPGA